MYKVTVLTFSPYKLDKNSAQNAHCMQNDRTVSRDCFKIRSEIKVHDATLTRRSEENFSISRVISIALYILLGFSLGHSRCMYKAEIISESKKSVKHRSEYHLGWMHAKYRVYRGPLCSCKNRYLHFGFHFRFIPPNESQCSVFKYKISEISIRDHFFFFSFSLHRFSSRLPWSRSDLSYFRSTDLRWYIRSV